MILLLKLFLSLSSFETEKSTQKGGQFVFARELNSVFEKSWLMTF